MLLLYCHYPSISVLPVPPSSYTCSFSTSVTLNKLVCFLCSPTRAPAFAYSIKICWGFDSIASCQLPVATGPVVEITIAPQHDCQPLMMKRQGGNKSSPQSCRCWCWELFVVWRCLWGRGGMFLCEYECVWVCEHVLAKLYVCVLYICLWACVLALWPSGYEEPSWEEEWVHSSWLSGAGGHTGTQRGDERPLCRCHPLGFSGLASKCHVWQLARCCSPTSCWQKRLLKDARVGCKHREHPNGSNIKESCWLLSVIEH